jgi:hypothetical protein
MSELRRRHVKISTSELKHFQSPFVEFRNAGICTILGAVLAYGTHSEAVPSQIIIFVVYAHCAAHLPSSFGNVVSVFKAAVAH